MSQTNEHQQDHTPIPTVEPEIDAPAGSGGSMPAARHGFRRALPWAAGVVALFVGIGMGGVSPQGEIDDLKRALSNARAEEDELTDQIAALSEERAELDGELDEVSSEYNELKSSFEPEIDEITQETEWLHKKLGKRSQKLDARAQSIASRESKIKQREQDVAARERRVALIERSSFGDGTWKVGADITPGVYRARGGGSCYWAILNSTDTWDIASNGVSVANPTVTLSVGKWFETNDCGEWRKIG